MRSLSKILVLILGGALALFVIYSIYVIAWEGVSEDDAKYEACCENHGGCPNGPTPPCEEPRGDELVYAVAALHSVSEILIVSFLCLAIVAVGRRVHSYSFQLVLFLVAGICVGTLLGQVYLRIYPPKWLELAR